MKKEGKFISLKYKLSRFCLIVFAVLLAFSVYVYVTSQQLLKESQEMVLLYKSAANYYMVFDHIDRALYQFAHTPSNRLKSSIEADSGLLMDISATLSLSFDDPIASDQLEIARNYVRALMLFLENDGSISMTEMLRQYNELYQTKLLITRLNKTLEVSIEAARIENEQRVDEMNRWQRWIFLFLLVFLVTLSIVYTKRFSQKLLDPILHLTKITKTAWDTPDYKVPQRYPPLSGLQDEAQILTMNYFRMLERLGKQMTELEEKARLEQQLRIEETQRAKIQKELDGAHMQILQSQVNPHFLFNAISTSSELAFIEGAQQTKHLLNQIAVYLRYALSKVDKIVTLKDEKQNIEAYVNIQQMRFGDRIVFSLNFASGCLDVHVPAMILQPLVENAIAHGVGNMRRGGKVEVSALTENGRVIITITDNGQGIPEDKLAMLRNRLLIGLEYNDGQGIGLMNAYNRLQLFFDNQASCTIISQPDVKTCFTLTFPIKQSLKTVEGDIGS